MRLGFLLAMVVVCVVAVGSSEAAEIPFEDRLDDLEGTATFADTGLSAADTGYAIERTQFEECRDRAVALYNDCMAYQMSGQATHPKGVDWLAYSQALCEEKGLQEYGNCMGHYGPAR